MVYHIEINDSTMTGKSLVNFLMSLSKKSRFIDFLTPAQVEDIEDELLLKKMERNMKGKNVSRDEVMNLLDNKINK